MAAERRSQVAAGVLFVVLALPLPAIALFTEPLSVGGNAFTTTTVNPPTLDSATADLVACTINLSWTAPGGLAPDGYDVYRSTTSGGPYSFVKHVGVVTSTSDTGLSANTTYHYVLQSTRDNWRSVDSNQRSATTALLCV